MEFLEHLEILRKHVMRCLVVFFLGVCVCYYFSENLMVVLRAPLFRVIPAAQQKLYFTNLFENFLTHLSIAGYASVFLLSPYYFYELWSFVKPGLKTKERKLVIPFVTAATFFFLAGAGFAYFVVFPIGFRYFITYGGPADIPLLTIGSFYKTCLKLLLLFGLAFELPILVCLLGFLKVVTPKILRQYRKQAIIAITIMSALFAPPDAVSMLILGVPLVLMYEGSIYVVQWFIQKEAQK